MKLFCSFARTGLSKGVFLTGLSAIAALGFLSGCATDEEVPVDRTAMLNKDDQVSDVPWNKPQGWENKGGLGALANNPRIGGGQ